ncbi:lipid kinase, YegS/Rv2252/BmrU family [Oceanobacillus limi]|uniref:Lipid kinase, YegS/Rv2252/BmrU family n=1 Tax=Oceanobacillus limi TaxID=930131 RepID=A0A1I0HEG1_9BACI|nr:diacylglycerol kinase family protein [Oceanobacillus limi]SET82296.1 lipid kinase, YegS/Rv2252/BmrU family [Oceanobacillus limi]
MYLFIVNQVAGNGRGKRIFNKIRKSTRYQQLESTYVFTDYEGHAEEIAREATKNNLVNLKAIVVIGGDGTLHEVMNRMEDISIPLAFIPGGSGNDFARGMNLPNNPLEILKHIIEADIQQSYWLGNFSLEDAESKRFVNSIGFGFDAEIANIANQSWYKKVLNLFRLGSFSYAIALIHVLFQFRPFKVEIEMNNRKRVIEQCWMITIANHMYYGGGMKIIPNAKIQPTTFPVLLIHRISKWKILGMFITVFTGKHVNFKEVELLEASKVSILTEENIHYQVDGQTNRCSRCTVSKESTSIQIIG